MSMMLLAAAAFYVVDAMSPEKCLPDAPPPGGVKGGEVRLIAAKGEYESGSFVVVSDVERKNETATWGDLVAADGSRIPASALDLKVVVCWYQQGTAWYGFHSDMTRRVLTPELLVHDERLIRVDHATQDNYVRCDYPDGRTDWVWTTALPLDCNVNGGFYNFRSEWIHDADRLQPFDLPAGRHKQFWITLGVPATAAPGLYRGAVRLAGLEVPLVVRVLPFELPRPATFRDVERPFYVSMYMGWDASPETNDRVAKDCVAHNLTSPFLDKATEDPAFYERLKRFGFETDHLFTVLPSAYHPMSAPPAEDDRQWPNYRSFLCMLTNSVRGISRNLGPDAVPYAYGYDEAGPDVIRAERASWRAVHALGGRVITATRMHDYILFALDAANIPSQPSPLGKKACDVLHASNPEMLVGWYSDPHSGPENPELARRQYGWASWRSNYDRVCQYTMFHRGWVEFNRPYENDLRSLSMCYVGDGQLIGTLQWEGFREAIDDIRYATRLKKLALEASKSKDVDVMYMGRAALTWLAQVAYETSSLESLRLETISRTLKLMKALKR